MGSSLLITLREGLEISLVLAIILGYLAKSGRTGYFHRIWLGSGLAVLVCTLTGIAFHVAVGEFEGKSEQFIEGTLAFSAVAVLTWMIFWMRSHARGIKADLQDKLSSAIDRSPWALVAVAFVAVAREGFETVLFLVGAENQGTSGAQVVIGGLIGLAVAAVLGLLIYRGGRHIDLGKFFAWTGGLLLLFAAGLFAKGVHEWAVGRGPRRAQLPQRAVRMEPVARAHPGRGVLRLPHSDRLVVPARHGERYAGRVEGQVDRRSLVARPGLASNAPRRHPRVTDPAPAIALAATAVAHLPA